MFWLKIIQKIIRLLHSEISPSEIAAGVAFGVILGLVPLSLVLGIFVFLLIFLLKVNIGAALFSALLFKLVAYFADPLADIFGYALLVDARLLAPFWSYLYNLPIVPFTRFNNTVVLGSILISIILFVPVYLLAKKFIIYYRTNLKTKVEKLKIVKVLKLTKIYGIYDKLK